MAEIIFTLVFNVFFFVLLNNFSDQIQFLNSDFALVLPYFNASIFINVGLAIGRTFVRTGSFKHLSQIIGNVVFFVLAYQLWIVFPFDTSVIGDTGTWDNIFKVIIVLTVAAVGIGTVAEVGKLGSSDE